MKGFAEAQRAYDNMLPPEYDVNECPVCGAELEKDDDGFRCPECDFAAYPDYED